jgi:hypothetical protein
VVLSRVPSVVLSAVLSAVLPGIAGLARFLLRVGGFPAFRAVRHLYVRGYLTMNRRPAQEALPLLVVVLGLVSFAVARDLQSPAGLAAALGGVLLRPLALIPVTAVPVAALTARVVVTRRSLAARTRLVVLAPDSFDPTLDGVLRCAAQLSRVRRVVGGWLDPRTSAVRVLLDLDAEGRMRYSLVVPERALPAVRAALGFYDRVELRTIEPEHAGEAEASTENNEQELDREQGKEKGLRVVRAELRLARPSSEPLAHFALNPDPLQSFARVLAALDHERGEQAQVALDLLPTTPATRRRLRRRLLREARRLGERTTAGEGGGLLDALGSGRRTGRQPPAEMVGQRAAREEIGAKLLQAEPLFGLQVLVRCQAPEKGRAVQCLQGLLGCFDAFAAANSFRVVGVRLFGLAFLGSDLPGRRGWFDRRMRTGVFRPARRGFVSAREVAGFLKPPSVHCAIPEVLRLGPAVFPAPKTLPTFTEQGDVVPLGRVEGESGERVVGLRLEDSFFTYIAGRSRWGKTELALGQFLHLVRSGHGGLFLDPHQDAIARVKSCLTEEQHARRVVELDLVGARSREGQPGWNLFAARGLSAEAAESRVEAIVDSFASALQWGERNNRALMLTTQATGALIELAAVLPEDLQPTIFQIPTILGNPEWLGVVLPFLSVPRRQFFTERFPRLAEEAITPVTNLIDRLRSSTQLAALLGAQTSTYDIAQAMNEKRIVLACPGAGGAKDKLIANLLVYDLLHAAKSRAHIPPERRSSFYVFLDEIQVFDGASSGNLAALLEQTAKYGVRGFLLNQNPERLTQATLNALTTNRSHLIATALNAHAAGLIAREWGGDPPAGAISGLPRRTFLAQVTHHGELTRPFLFHNLAVPDLLADAYQPGRVAHAQPTIDEASGRTPAAQTIAALDTLDERIKSHLSKQNSNSPRDSRDAGAKPAGAGEPEQSWYGPPVPALDSSAGES